MVFKYNICESITSSKLVNLLVPHVSLISKVHIISTSASVKKLRGDNLVEKGDTNLVLKLYLHNKKNALAWSVGRFVGAMKKAGGYYWVLHLEMCEHT